ncbi:hypothetical protein BH09VER1_BH09VER1_44710 [soil metagenome]
MGMEANSSRRSGGWFLTAGRLSLLIAAVVWAGSQVRGAESEGDTLKETAAQWAKLDGEMASALKSLGREDVWAAYLEEREAWEKYRAAQANFAARNESISPEGYDRRYRAGYEKVTKERIASLEEMLTPAPICYGTEEPKKL